jgi:DegV family protein with EDD domain
MPKIAIVTDSTAYLPPGLIQKHKLTITPLVVIWGEETFEDGVDIQPSQFYTRLKTAKVMPSTSQATPATMVAAFESLIMQDYDEILGIFLSSNLSGTIDSAMQAKDLMQKGAEKVTIVDSKTTAMALGFQVLAVANAIENGANLGDAVALAEKARANTGVFFAVDTLEFLHRGGRIGGAQRFLGTALNMKPVLTLQDGRVEALERIRTKKKAHNRVLELITEQVQGKDNIRLATLSANAEVDAKALLENAEKQLNPVETIFTEISPVLGTHVGPGTVGLAYIAGI